MLTDTAEELRQIALAATDATGYFPALYSRVTSAVAAASAQRGFADGARLEALASTFAAQYTAAFHRTVPRPKCWQAGWDVARDRNLLIVQHLLLGINAHVNYDLPRAVVLVADETGDLASMRPDFDAINDILATTHKQVIVDLDKVARWTNEAGALGGSAVFNFSLGAARRQAWSAAERLHRLDAAGAAAYVGELDRLVSVLAYLITKPSFPLSIVARLARLLERRDPHEVCVALLGGT